MVRKQKITIKTRSNCDVVDMTEQVFAAVDQANISSGAVTLFNIGSTAGITTTEQINESTQKNKRLIRYLMLDAQVKYLSLQQQNKLSLRLSG